MKKFYRVAVLLLALALVLSACGKAAGTRKYESDLQREVYNNAPQPGSDYVSDSEAFYAAGDPIKAAGDAEVVVEGGNQGDGPLTILEPRDNTKVIYTANLSLQTIDFDKTCKAIRTLCTDLGGYMEDEEISNHGYNNSSSTRRASFTVRIPSSGYDEFINSVGDDVCKVKSINQSKDDVGAEYFDVEQRLETLNNKHDRLEALLAKADNMSDIIELEGALSDTEYQINRLRSTLNRYDSLVNYSTIIISLAEVSGIAGGIDENPGFFARLGRSFTEGFQGFASSLEDMAYWLSYNLLTIIVLAVIAIAVFKIHPIRRIKKAIATSKEKKLGAQASAE